MTASRPKARLSCPGTALSLIFRKRGVGCRPHAASLPERRSRPHESDDWSVTGPRRVSGVTRWAGADAAPDQPAHSPPGRARRKSQPCWIAARLGGLSRSAFRATKSWTVPRKRVAVASTPASLRRRAYCSPSSRAMSASAVTTSAAGSPSRSPRAARSGEAVGSVQAFNPCRYSRQYRRCLGPLRAQAPGQRPPGLVRRHRPQRHRMRAVARHQPAQLAATGHDHSAPRRARQQRFDLLGVAGVVQHHQHPPAGQHAPEPGGSGVDLVGQRTMGDPERLQEPAQHLTRSHHQARGVEAPQVDVQLAVGEPVGHLVRTAQRQTWSCRPRPYR